MSHVKGRLGHSERRICRALGISRSTVRYEPQSRADESTLTGAIRVGIPDSETARRYAEDVMPSATLVPIRTKKDLDRILQEGGADFDAIGASSEEGAAWTILYPDFSLVVPQPPAFIRVGYAVARDNIDLLYFVDTWLLTAKARGTVDALYDYWMLGRTKKTRPPRWSVIRDLLHWVD